MRDLAHSRRRWLAARWLLALLVVVPPAPVRADEPSRGDNGLWREGVALIGTLWADARARLRDDRPQWLYRPSRQQWSTELSAATAGAAYVALQDSRADGTDLLTLRYTLDAQGPLHTYAGAGLSHSQYYFDRSLTGLALLSRQQRRMDLGPAAELGAELAVSEHVRISADLRWADFDHRASVLRGESGPIAADAVMLGVTLGYRFR